MASVRERLATVFRRRKIGPETAVKPTPADEKVTAGQVFTPTSPADRTFVPRLKEEKLLVQALRTRGTQILLYGESGAGKSSLAIKVLRDGKRSHIVTRCTSKSSYEDVIKSAFDKLGTFSVISRKTADKTDLHADVTTKVGSDLTPGSVKFEGGFAKIVELIEQAERVVEYQLTAENLVLALSKRELSWVFEDFHKVDTDTRTQLADALKVFSDHADPNTAIVVLGASETATDIVAAPADMTNRLSQIPVPPLDSNQLGRILDDGGDIMRVDFSKIRQIIISTSAGVASVTHALALRCLQELEIEIPPATTVVVDEATLRLASRSYASSMQGGMKAQFEKAIFLKQKRMYDNCAIIVKALAGLPERGGTHAEILAEIRKTFPEYPPGNLTTYLVQLGTEERGSIIRKTADGRHRFDEPLQHTYAQIRFKLDPREDDLFAKELEAKTSPDEQERALAAANEDIQQ